MAAVVLGVRVRVEALVAVSNNLGIRVSNLGFR